MKGELLHSINSLRKAICSCLVVLSLAHVVGAQTVTIDFDYLKQVKPSPFPPYVLPPDWRLPWHEDGFVVGSTNRSDFAQIIGTIPDRGDSPPYPGVLNLFGARGMSSVTITNEASLTFDLLSVDVLTLGLGLNSLTNYATIVSSTGGRFSLLGTPDGTTVPFPADSQWQSLTFLRIEFLTAFPAEGLQLDNFVLRTHGVPEPSVLALIGSAGFVMVLMHRRIGLVSSIDRDGPA